MAKKVFSSNLTKANKDNIDNLELVIKITTKVGDLLDDFISNTTDQLKGSGYDMIRVKVSLYKEAYIVLHTVSENLLSSIYYINNSMLNYMEGYEYLDNSQVGELSQYLSNIAAYIDYLSQKSASDGLDYSAEIAEWQELYNKIKHLIELLKGLSSKDNELFTSLEAIINDVENVARMVDGINESTFTKEGLEALKNGSHKIYNYDPNKIIFSEEYKTIPKLPEVDTSNMSDNAINILNEIMETWPEDMTEDRIIAIQTALTLLDKGIGYSMDYRHSKDSNGFPRYMDCSSFVTYCLRAAGVDIDPGAYTGTYLRSNSNFYTIERDDLMPGDVGLINGSSDGFGANHIGLFIGYDSNGNEVWAECTGSKSITISTGNGSWSVFRRYSGF